jgi:AcrR family transcriptional regulator
MPRRTHECPRGRILDAAEDAFADSGFNGASLRRIGLEARVNLATIYYYYGSKAGLMEAVLKRRFDPLREEHLGLLRQFEQGAGDCPLPVEKILEAMLLPTLRLAVTAPPRQRAISRLLGRIFTEPNPKFQKALRSQHERHLSDAFFQAMRRSLPELPVPDLRCRLDLIWGAMGLILCNPGKMERELRGTEEPIDLDEALARMIGFFAPGMRAPAFHSTPKPE